MQRSKKIWPPNRKVQSVEKDAEKNEVIKISNKAIKTSIIKMLSKLKKLEKNMIVWGEKMEDTQNRLQENPRYKNWNSKNKKT